MKRSMMVFLLACACGSSNGGSNDAGPTTGNGTITGTVGGHGLTVKDAVFGIDSTTKAMTVVVSDRADLCTILAGNTLPAGTTTVLAFVLVNYPGGTSLTDVTTGAYAWFDSSNPVVPSPGLYFDSRFILPTSCTAAATTAASGGTLNVTQAGTAAGTHLKVTLGSIGFGSDSLGGSFEATYCAAAANPVCGGSALVVRPGPLQ